MSLMLAWIGVLLIFIGSLMVLRKGTVAALAVGTAGFALLIIAVCYGFWTPPPGVLFSLSPCWYNERNEIIRALHARQLHRHFRLGLCGHDSP
jgi:hypothetical protein